MLGLAGDRYMGWRQPLGQFIQVQEQYRPMQPSHGVTVQPKEEQAMLGLQADQNTNLQNLMAMGFDEPSARRELLAAGGDVHAAAAALVANPQATAPPDPAEQKLTLQVAVPQGATPGQLLAVDLPDGRQVTVQVPAQHNGVLLVPVPDAG
mmetsp:Transcript_52513/g.139360  ORF Transcript_52513/g.139360 Transcript_52513/m.139360 type:complete len:151 (-) Transcript_52513:45-497(-)